MSDYRAPVKDMLFVMDEIVGLDDVGGGRERWRHYRSLGWPVLHHNAAPEAP